MGVSAPVAAKANGLSTVIDTIASPNEAFERQRTAPTWGWALAITIVLLLAGAYLQGPAARHANAAQTQHMIANSPIYATLSDAKKQQILDRAGKPSLFSYVGPVVFLFVGVLLNTLFMLIGNAVGKGEADFKRLWCGSMNIAVPTLGLGAIVLGVITTMRGPDAFSNGIQLLQAMPSLATLAPNAGVVLVALLAGISVFTVWGFFLNATMLRVTGKTSSAVAYAFAAIVLLLGAGTGAAFTALGHKAGLF